MMYQLMLNQFTCACAGLAETFFGGEIVTCFRQWPNNAKLNIFLETMTSNFCITSYCRELLICGTETTDRHVFQHKPLFAMTVLLLVLQN